MVWYNAIQARSKTAQAGRLRSLPLRGGDFMEIVYIVSITIVSIIAILAIKSIKK